MTLGHNTFHWTFFVKFGLKTPSDMPYDILWWLFSCCFSLLTLHLFLRILFWSKHYIFSLFQFHKMAGLKEAKSPQLLLHLLCGKITGLKDGKKKNEYHLNFLSYNSSVHIIACECHLSIYNHLCCITYVKNSQTKTVTDLTDRNIRCRITGTLLQDVTNHTGQVCIPMSLWN